MQPLRATACRFHGKLLAAWISWLRLYFTGWLRVKGEFVGNRALRTLPIALFKVFARGTLFILSTPCSRAPPPVDEHSINRF